MQVSLSIVNIHLCRTISTIHTFYCLFALQILKLKALPSFLLPSPRPIFVFTTFPLLLSPLNPLEGGRKFEACEENEGGVKTRGAIELGWCNNEEIVYPYYYKVVAGVEDGLYGSKTVEKVSYFLKRNQYWSSL